MKKIILLTFLVAVSNLTFAQSKRSLHNNDTLNILLTDLINKRFIKIGQETFKINISIDKVSKDNEIFDWSQYVDTATIPIEHYDVHLGNDSTLVWANGIYYIQESNPKEIPVNH